MKTPQDRKPAASTRLPAKLLQATDADDRLGDSPRMAAQRQQLGAAFGPVAQRVRIRKAESGTYNTLAESEPLASGDIETDTLLTNDIRLLLNQQLAGSVKQALAERLIKINDEKQQELQSQQATISVLDSENNDLKGRIDTATTYLEEDGQAISNGAVFRELVIPVITGSLALVNGPVNAFLNTATRVDVSLATAGVATALQIANDATLIWSADGHWRRGYLITAMACQMASQMLMTVPGTDAPLFQAPPQNDTLASNTAPVSLTGSYEGNKWIFLAVALVLGLLATFFRLLDSRESKAARTRESKRRVDEVKPNPGSEGEHEGGINMNRID